MPNKLTQFLKEVRQELKKVSWPSRQETIKYTLIVVGVSVAVAIFLGGLDFLFVWALNKFISCRLKRYKAMRIIQIGMRIMRINNSDHSHELVD